MGQMADVVSSYLSGKDWVFEREDSEDDVTLRFAIEGKNGRFMIYALNYEKERQLVFYSVFPIKAPPEYRPAISEFVQRANRGMIIGNYEIDLEDGEVLFKTSIEIDAEALTPKLCDALLRANVTTMDTYFPGLLDVTYGKCSPVEALAKLED